MQDFIDLLSKYDNINVHSICEFNGCWSFLWIVNHKVVTPFPIKGSVSYSPRGYDIGVFNAAIRNKTEALNLFEVNLDSISKYIGS
jgi:hypothetical protein